jgi:CBS domain-containing protein
MALVREILTNKGGQVWSVGKDATVLQAAMLMTEHKIGALVVLDREQIAGMFSERDVLQRVVGEQRDPTRTTVGEVMTAEVACCTPETTIEEARLAMKDRRIRHIPVVDNNGKLIGLISIGDLNAFEAASQEQTIFLMHEYIYGRV